MIKLIMTSEFIADMLTPGVIASPIECTEGLPPYTTLKEVSMDVSGNVTYLFEDGKEEVTPAKIKFERPKESK